MMMRYLIALLLTLLSSWVGAEELPHGLALAPASINRNDVESIKRGAKFFATTCMSCHTMVYMRYNQLATEAGVSYDKMPINVKNWPLGVKPPDLSLEADIRGVDWIYTYLHSFYQDPSRPTGVNNLVFPNTAMPAILAPYQGEQQLAKTKPEGSILFGGSEWYDYLVQTRQGTMTPEQFDATTRDLVNFLAYAAQPFHQEQRKIGFWVLAFLILLFPLMLMLKREYWKDVKRHRQNNQ